MSVVTRLRRLAWAGGTLGVIALSLHGAHAQNVPERADAVLPAITVVGTMPLPGFATPLAQVPSNVQTFDARLIGRAAADGVASFLDRNANSVTLGAPSGNTFQSDLSFRGFIASPLLGTPQGLSVFQDGVRINEAFADVVHWDLLPQNAIASMQLLPGSNPVFGLNTLGGALAINMKDGFRHPVAELDVSGGAFGRRAAAAELGIARETAALYAAGEALDERGWREHSATRIRRMYSRADWRHGADEAGVALSLADNALAGTQALPLSMLNNPRQAYTWPDTTRNRLAFVNASWTHAFDDDTVLATNLYWRQLTSTGVNSNVNGNQDPVDSPAAAFNVRSRAVTVAGGGSLQWSARRTLGTYAQQWVLGAAFDTGDTRFGQENQTATFARDRETVGTGPFAVQTSVETRVRNASVYAADTFFLSPAWTLVLSGRYNTARVATRDKTGAQPAIDGTHDFQRFNPALGITWQAASSINLFGNVSQGMRVPTAVELTCADPLAPCTLPNIFVADPPLRPVLATTYELGMRGTFATGVFYSAAFYRTAVVDDIQFVGVGSGAVNAGYFRNLGRTRRQGVELAGGTRLQDLKLTARYSLTEASFRSAFQVSSPNNSTADAAGLIDVVPGNRLPGVPRQTLRLRADWVHEPWSAGVAVQGQGGQYARGDENNRDASGRVPGFAVVSADATWQIDRAWQVFASIDNVFNRRYQNFGILGANYFRGAGTTFDASLAGPEAFRSPGAPFGVWIGVRHRLDRGRRGG